MSLGEFVGSGASVTKGLWHLNGSSADSSGNSNNGTDTAITYSQANGKLGQGAGFDGSTSKIDLPNYSSGGTNATISSWIKYTVNTSSLNVIYGQRTASQALWTMFTDNASANGKINATFRGESGGGTCSAVSTNALNDGLWHNVIAVWNGSAGSVSLYVDGNYNSIGTGAATGDIFSSNDQTRIGAGYNSGGKWNGQIDETIVEARGWTSSEIKKYFTNAKGRFGIV